MRVTSKGQVTIPRRVREQLCIKPGTDVDFVLDENGAHLVRLPTKKGSEIVNRMRGRATVLMSTEEIMALTRDPEDETLSHLDNG